MLDIVSDTYQNCSIKEVRGIGKTVNFNEDDYMPETFEMKDFFQSSVNKMKLIENNSETCSESSVQTMIRRGDGFT